MAQYRVIVNTVTKQVEAVINVASKDSITYLPTNEDGEDLEAYIVTNLKKLLAKLSVESTIDLTELEQQEAQEALNSNQITAYEKGTPSTTVNPNFNYVVSLPPNYDPIERDYAVVFYFHGDGRSESAGGIEQVLENDLMLFLQSRNVQTIVFAPQNNNLVEDTWTPTAPNEFVDWVLNNSEWADAIDPLRMNALGEGFGSDAILDFMNNANDGGLTQHWKDFNTVTLVNSDVRSIGNGLPRYAQVDNNNVLVWLIGTGADANFANAELWHNIYLTANPTGRTRITKYTDATKEKIKHIPYRTNKAITQETQTTQLRACFEFDRSIENYWQFVKDNPKP